MARDGCFFSFAAAIHPKYRVPSRSIVLQAVIAVCMVLLGTFDQILTYMGFSLGMFPLLAVFGVFVLRKRKLLQYRMPGFPVAPLVYLAAGSSILVLGFWQRPLESGIAVATALVGIPVYSAFRRRSRNPGRGRVQG
jgi:APA family basic amino acid/polyamine antiporter